MLTASLALRNKEKWKPYWNKALVFLFIATFFLDGITRYKHIISILMIITVIYQVSRAPGTFKVLYKNNLFIVSQHYHSFFYMLLLYHLI